MADNQHSRLPITSLAEAQGYIEHLEEQLEAQAQAFEKQHVRHMEDARFYNGKITEREAEIARLKEQLETQQKTLDLVRAMVAEKGVDPADLAHELEKVLGISNPASEPEAS